MPSVVRRAAPHGVRHIAEGPRHPPRHERVDVARSHHDVIAESCRARRERLFDHAGAEDADVQFAVRATSEMGICMSLGADRGRVLRMVLSCGTDDTR